MSKGCQSRIRGYLTKARAQLFAEKFDTLQNKNKYGGKDVSKFSDKQSCQNEEHDDTQWDEVDARELKLYRGKIVQKTNSWRTNDELNFRKY